MILNSRLAWTSQGDPVQVNKRKAAYYIYLSKVLQNEDPKTQEKLSLCLGWVKQQQLRGRWMNTGSYLRLTNGYPAQQRVQVPPGLSM
jgi:hypothetical protein